MTYLNKFSLYILILICIIAIFFYRILDNFFLIDDFIFIDHSTRLGDNLSSIFILQVVPFVRPLNNLLYFLLYKIFAFDFTGYHLVSLAFHTANTVLVFSLAKSLTKNIDMSFCIALIFATNFAPFEAIFWISGMTDLEVAFFYLLTIFFFLNYLNSRKKVSLIASLLSYALSLLSKESAVTLPVILFFIYFFFPDKNKIDLKGFLRDLSYHLLLTLFFLIIHLSFQLWLGLIGSGDYKITLNAVGFLLVGFFMFILPPQILYLFEPNQATQFEGQETELFLSKFGLTINSFESLFFFSLFIIVPVIIYFFYRIFISDNQVLKFGLLMFFVALLPYSFLTWSFKPRSHNMCIASVGYSMFFVALIWNISQYFKGILWMPVFRAGIILLVVALNFMLIQTADEDSERYGDMVHNMIIDLKYLYPSLPEGKAIYFVSIPVEDLDIQAIVRLFYKNTSYQVKKIDKTQLEFEELDQSLVLEFKQGKLVDRTIFYQEMFNKMDKSGGAEV